MRLVAAVLIVIALLALAAPWLSPWSHDALDWQHLEELKRLGASSLMVLSVERMLA